MTNSNLEHVNLTVSNPQQLADQLCQIFGWKIRWAGEARNKGLTVHVGTDTSYLALYTNNDVQTRSRRETEILNLNHVAIEVNDLDEIESKVIDQNLETFNHGDYEPGKRFYFQIQKDLEIEVVSYA